MAAPFATHSGRNFLPALPDPAPVEWIESPPGAILGPAACHVWKVEPHRALPGAMQILDSGERARMSGFFRPVDGVRFAGTRIALRAILAGYLNCQPQKIVFEKGSHGRPALAAKAIDFNVAHSGSLALIAISAHAVGIDVEALREVKDVLSLSQRHFQPAELRDFEQVAPSARSRAFLGCWTRKEAVLKSTGIGLALGASRIDVGLGPQPRTVELPAPAMHLQMRVLSLAPGESHVGACAVPVHVEHLEFRHLVSGQA